MEIVVERVQNEAKSQLLWINHSLIFNRGWVKLQSVKSYSRCARRINA